MAEKEYLKNLVIPEDAALSARLVDTFVNLNGQDGIKTIDIVTRLKDQMEKALRPATDATD